MLGAGAGGSSKMGFPPSFSGDCFSFFFFFSGFRLCPLPRSLSGLCLTFTLLSTTDETRPCRLLDPHGELLQVKVVNHGLVDGAADECGSFWSVLLEPVGVPLLLSLRGVFL